MPVSGSPYKDKLQLQLGVGLSAEQMAALTGDVINERSVTRYDSALDGRTWERSFADSAARVEAANSLNVQAG
ncbi:TPA: hypothetical protein L4892_006964, partial [Pseudomonas aeruginosa]|nr:hypothetical protein [Pseudomonas aeruginosa]